MVTFKRAYAWAASAFGAVALLLIVPAYLNRTDIRCEKAFPDHIYLTLPIRWEIESHWRFAKEFPTDWRYIVVDHSKLGMPRGSSVELGRDRLIVTMGDECEKYAGDQIELIPSPLPDDNSKLKWACTWKTITRDPCTDILTGPLHRSSTFPPRKSP